MSDLRATERLLEVIEERIDRRIARDADTGAPMADLNAIKDEIRELRRRGDTLVRRDDLEAAVGLATEYVNEYENLESYARDRRPLLNRLEIALGGKLR